MTREFLAVAIVLALCVQADARAKAPTLKIRISPQMAVYSPLRPVLVRAWVTWSDQTGEKRCPAYTLDFGNGQQSRYEADCDPTETGPYLDTWHPGPGKYSAPGEYDLVATATVGKTSIPATARLYIVGEP